MFSCDGWVSLCYWVLRFVCVLLYLCVFVWFWISGAFGDAAFACVMIRLGYGVRALVLFWCDVAWVGCFIACLLCLLGGVLYVCV